MIAKISSLAALVFVVAMARLIPHAPNFTPMLAVALFAGAKSPSRYLAYILPVLALWLGDLFLGTHGLMDITAVGLLIATLIGEFAERSPASRLKRVGIFMASGLAASVVFFMMTNVGVWTTSNMYPRTREGLWTCFAMALPFFSNQVLSTWLFTGVLFGIWRLVEPVLQPAPQTI